MTTKTDNYRELEQELREHIPMHITGSCMLELLPVADAIAALIKQRDALREALQRAQTDFERIARGVIAPERAADMSAQEIAAALANAPTPNDKGK